LNSSLKQNKCSSYAKSHRKTSNTVTYLTLITQLLTSHLSHSYLPHTYHTVTYLTLITQLLTSHLSHISISPSSLRTPHIQRITSSSLHSLLATVLYSTTDNISQPHHKHNSEAIIHRKCMYFCGVVFSEVLQSLIVTSISVLFLIAWALAWAI